MHQRLRKVSHIERLNAPAGDPPINASTPPQAIPEESLMNSRGLAGGCPSGRPPRLPPVKRIRRGILKESFLILYYECINAPAIDPVNHPIMPPIRKPIFITPDYTMNASTSPQGIP